MSEHDAFQRDGWERVEVASAAWCARALSWLEATVSNGRISSMEPQYENAPDRSDQAKPLRKLRRLFWADPGFWTPMICETGILPVVRRLVPGRASLIMHAAFLKPAGFGSAVGYHQDQALWLEERPGALSIWMPLVAADGSNGGIEVCDRSCHLGLLPHEPTPAHPEHAVVSLDRHGLRPSVVPCQQGQAVLIDRYTVHGSARNRSEGPRPAMVLVFANRDAPGFAPLDQHSFW
jgi:hypothetical protein